MALTRERRCDGRGAAPHALDPRHGFSATTGGAAVITVMTLVPLALVVLRYRGPGRARPWTRRDGGSPGENAGRDGAGVDPCGTAAVARALERGGWLRARAEAQVGFFTHQVKLAEPILAATGAGWLVGATGLAGLLGRLLLAWLDVGSSSGPTRSYLRHQALALVLIVISPARPSSSP